MRRLTAPEIDRLYYSVDSIAKDVTSNMAFHRLVKLLEGVHRIPRVPGAEAVDQVAMHLINTATEAGLVVTIERQPLKPLAMGHASYVVSTRELRGATTTQPKDAPHSRTRDEASILRVMTPEHMAAEIVRLDRVIGGDQFQMTMGRLPPVDPGHWQEQAP